MIFTDLRRRTMAVAASGLPAKKTLQNTSWADIAIIAAAGMGDTYWNVGDTKTIALGSTIIGSTSITVKIIGFDYDDLAAGGKAPISFGMADLFATYTRMRPTNVNYPNGWTDCEFRATLINTVLPVLQTAIGANIIKPVTKRTGAGYDHTVINTTTDSVWLMSEFEVAGTTTLSMAGEKPTDISVCYPAFTDNASRIRKNGSTASFWYLRSPKTPYGTAYVCVTNLGALDYTNASLTNRMAIGFCV